MNYKQSITILSTFAFLIVIFVLFGQQARTGEVFLGGKTFLVEIADTDALRIQGLSGHAPLSDKQGMIFIFDKPDKYGFWMKDMLFPIDIIWIDENFKITHIEKSLTPETYPTIFYPTEKSLYVLEISSGQAETLNLKIGDTVKLLKN